MSEEEKQPRLLLVEDDPVTADGLASYLAEHGYQVATEARGDTAPLRIVEQQPDLVLLDLDLPGKDGFQVIHEVRPRYAGPILVITVRGSDLDHVLALEFGADDFIVKPAAPRIVLARVKAALRRAAQGGNTGRGRTDFVFGSLRIDRNARAVHLDGREIAFTTAEFDLLWLLAAHAGEVLARDEIMTHLRGIGHDGMDRSIDMRISRLRKLLKDDGDPPRRIKTVRGRGYLLSPSDWD